MRNGTLTLVKRNKKQTNIGEHFCINTDHSPKRSATYDASIMGYSVGGLCNACAKEWATAWDAALVDEPLAA